MDFKSFDRDTRFDITLDSEMSIQSNLNTEYTNGTGPHRRISARGVRRLELAGGLIAQAKSMGGLAIHIEVGAEETYAHSVLRILHTLPDAEQVRIKSDVDWVEDYESARGPYELLRTKEPLNHAGANSVRVEAPASAPRPSKALTLVSPIGLCQSGRRTPIASSYEPMSIRSEPQSDDRADSYVVPRFLLVPELDEALSEAEQMDEILGGADPFESPNPWAGHEADLDLIKDSQEQSSRSRESSMRCG